jgi:hydrogenase nickel incorporation protein HypB
MCGTCGCGQPEFPSQLGDHGGLGDHGVPGDHGEARRVEVERSLLEHNDRDADRVSAQLVSRGIDSVGLLGGPGCGKTALLEATFARIGPTVSSHAVVEGDCATDRDAQRIARAGARVTQVVTGGVCHLDAHRVEHALEHLDLAGVRHLWVENVGNLVCPAPFRCGERRRAVLISVTEGDDKPEKYPAAIAAADLMVVTKTDLLPYVDFELERCAAAVATIRPDLVILPLSARSGEGMAAWLDWALSRAATRSTAGTVAEEGAA